MLSTKSWWKFEADGARHWEQVWADHWKGKSFPALLEDARTGEGADFVLGAIGADDIVLEAGCGHGQWVAAAGDRARRVVGLDLHAGPIRLGLAECPSLTLIQATLAALPFRDGSLDVILSFGVVEHFEGGFQAQLAEKRRVLKDGGTLVISVPYYNLTRRILEPFICLRRAVVSNPRIRALCGKQPYPPRRFYQYAYTEGRFRKLLRECGFESREANVYHTEFGLTRDYGPMRTLRRRHPRAFRALLALLTSISPRTIGHMQMHRAVKVDRSPHARPVG